MLVNTDAADMGSVPSSRGGARSRQETSTATDRPLAASEHPSPAPTSPIKRRKRRLRRPSTGSLFDVLRQHSGLSLFVRPICWTDLHARLLGAEFEELPPCDSPSPSSQPGSGPSQGHMQPSPAITILSNALSEILQPSAAQSMLSSNAVKVTLMTLWPGAFSKPQYLPELNLFWGGKVYHDAVRVQAMWNYPVPLSLSRASSQTSFETVATHLLDPQLAPSSPSTSATLSLPSSSAGSTSLSPPPPPPSLPMLCYVGKSRSSLIRRSIFRVCQGPGKSINMPVFRLQQLRSKALMPLDPDQDAHLIGIFLAMAQRHFYGVPHAALARRESYWWPRDLGRPPRPDFHDLTLRVLTSDSETAEFIVYTGHVTAAFLDRFHDPHASPSHDDAVPGIRIEYTKVPVWPILGLRERLGQALGHDIVGPFDPTQMETWHESDVDTELELELPSSAEDETPPAVEEHSNKSGRKRSRDRSRDRDRSREPMAHMFEGGYDDESGGEQDLGAKKRRLDGGNRVGVVV